MSDLSSLQQGFALVKMIYETPAQTTFQATEGGSDLGFLGVCAGQSMFPKEVRTFFSAGQRLGGLVDLALGVRFTPISPR